MVYNDGVQRGILQTNPCKKNFDSAKAVERDNALNTHMFVTVIVEITKPLIWLLF